MPKYRKTHQVDFYKKEKESNWGAFIFWGFVALVVIGVLAG